MGVFHNLEKIRADIDSVSCGVRLVVVTKKRDVDSINEVLSYGIHDIGESYISEIDSKFLNLSWGCCKHFIGPIQSNKVEKIVENFDVVQSVDRLKIVSLIDSFARKLGKVQSIFVQVNIPREEQKSGVMPDDLFEFMEEIRIFENIKVEGLMAIGSRISDSQTVRQSDSQVRVEFREMRRLFDKLNRFGYDLRELSMGMSDDYMLAINEGSTMVRVGRGVFDKIEVLDEKESNDILLVEESVEDRVDRVDIVL